MCQLSVVICCTQWSCMFWHIHFNMVSLRIFISSDGRQSKHIDQTSLDKTKPILCWRCNPQACTQHTNSLEFRKSIIHKDSNGAYACVNGSAIYENVRCSRQKRLGQLLVLTISLFISEMESSTIDAKKPWTLRTIYDHR